MPRPSLHRPPELALVIEVIDENHVEWTAMATEWERVLHELKAAPPAVAITIYEWELREPINPRDGWTRYPTWKRIGSRPWSINGDQD